VPLLPHTCGASCRGSVVIREAVRFRRIAGRRIYLIVLFLYGYIANLVLLPSVHAWMAPYSRDPWLHTVRDKLLDYCSFFDSPEVVHRIATASKL
jgi:hypothetical protein